VANTLFKSMRLVAGAAAIAAVALSAAAASAQTKSQQNKDKGQYIPTIWVDPDGCDHWIIDDGVEGYLSARLDKYGKPVCSGVAPPTQTVGDFKKGSTSIIGDAI
jgi:hypothetical protein